jgi:hypothetical protein
MDYELKESARSYSEFLPMQASNFQGLNRRERGKSEEYFWLPGWDPQKNSTFKKQTLYCHDHRD